VIPDLSNPQSWNHFSYTLNNPVRYNDPSGHLSCDDMDEDGKCINFAQNLFRKINKNYSDWERRILRKLYSQGGEDAMHGVEYIVSNGVHMSVGKPVKIGDGNPYGLPPSITGDWQSLGSVEGWYDRGNNSIVLNPNEGYKDDEMPSAWGLATIIHEAKHLEQGRLTKYGELEAWQIGFRVAEKLGHYGTDGINPGSMESNILKLPLSDNQATINQFSSYVQTYDSGYYFFFQFLPDR